jgi:hypothetical protein
MTRDTLRTDPEFTKWLSLPETSVQLRKLAELVDMEVGMVGYGMTEPHFVHVNFGIQDAVRRVRNLLVDPTGTKTPKTGGLPPARYGVNTET